MIPGSTVLSIRSRVLAWYLAERRQFPWRGATDPYAVLVSEVMLQQTQASRVAQRFDRFLRRFPTAASLAAASDAEVLAEWSGLGYNRRALALRRTAIRVTRDGWPDDLEGLIRLPGVGPYTARAIASLAFGRPVGVVDTNVRRWLLRRFGAVDRPAALQSIADRLAAPGRGTEVADWTHATMELGATVCRARAPRCGDCPIARGCPSRGTARAVHVPRQLPLHGSDRAYRGAVLRALTASVDHAVLVERVRRQVAADLDEGRWSGIIAGLERDGLVHRTGGRLRLGAATIGT